MSQDTKKRLFRYEVTKITPLDIKANSWKEADKLMRKTFYNRKNTHYEAKFEHDLDRED